MQHRIPDRRIRKGLDGSGILGFGLLVDGGFQRIRLKSEIMDYSIYSSSSNAFIISPHNIWLESSVSLSIFILLGISFHISARFL